MPHVSDHRLAAYMDGDLSPGEVREVEAHLVECAECRAEVTEVERVLRGDRGERARRRFLPVLGVAAAAVLVLLIPVALDRDRPAEDTLRTSPGTPEVEALSAIVALDPVWAQDASGGYRLELRWAPMEEVTEYRVTLTDSAGETIWSTTTQDNDTGGRWCMTPKREQIPRSPGRDQATR
jgi:hypothetical protein